MKLNPTYTMLIYEDKEKTNDDITLFCFAGQKGVNRLLLKEVMVQKT